MPSRRDFLRYSISILPFGIAGCPGNQTGTPAPATTRSPRPNETPTPQTPQSPTTTPEPFDPLDYVEEWHVEPIRAEGPAIAVEKTLDSLEPFYIECVSLATDTVRDRVNEQLDNPGQVSSGWGNVDHPEHENAVFIGREFVIERDGGVASQPDVTFDTLLKVTPKSIRATVNYEDHTHVCELPVFLKDAVIYIES